MDRIEIFIHFAGGIGIFLLGMVVMTEGLRALAGSAIRSALMRFTKSPLSGAVTGAASTAVLQSSSATTVAAVGFVGAELITFPEALGIIFGANIGTTFKGWLIAILGFKLNLVNIFFPLVFAGALLRLFSKGRVANIGYSVAGFGLIFVGIDFMQGAMSGFHDFLTFENMPADSLTSRLMLVGIGLLFSAITQSSSAGVVTTLTALFADLINFNQAAALVIGMDIGTTATAAMSTVGGSVGVKRTGFSHVIYNFMTASFALMLISPYTYIWEYFAPGQIVKNAEIALVAFHTFFNTIGVIAILPFTGNFAALMERIIPDRVSTYTQTLDNSLLADSQLALDAVQMTVKSEVVALFNHVFSVLDNSGKNGKANLDELQSALNNTHNYVDRIHLDSADGPNLERLVNLIHTLDHLQRLHERCEEEEDRAITARKEGKLKELSQYLTESLEEIIEKFENGKWNEAAVKAKDVSDFIHEHVKPFRQTVMSSVAEGRFDVYRGTSNVEAIRWLRRVSKHIARITMHYDMSVKAVGVENRMNISI